MFSKPCFAEKVKIIVVRKQDYDDKIYKIYVIGIIIINIQNISFQI
jgi:hypothetical protein